MYLILNDTSHYVQMIYIGPVLLPFSIFFYSLTMFLQLLILLKVNVNNFFMIYEGIQFSVHSSLFYSSNVDFEHM